MNTKIIGAIIVLILVGGGSFYAGMSYVKGQIPARGTQSGSFTGGAGSMRGGGARGTGGFASGQIVSADANSITIKLASGSTQIILIGTSTQVLKSTSGSTADLTPNTEVTVSGSANSDGSITAQSVQIRPAGMPGFGAPRSAGAQAQYYINL